MRSTSAYISSTRCGLSQFSSQGHYFIGCDVRALLAIFVMAGIAHADPGYDDPAVRARAEELAAGASERFTRVLQEWHRPCNGVTGTNIDAPSSDTAAEPLAGLASETAKTQPSWHSELSARINSHKRYPEEALAQHLQGIVKLHFTVDRVGQVVCARVVESSGSALLDAEAVAMLQRATPLPFPPPETPGIRFDLLLPIRFQIKDSIGAVPLPP
jgi:TonB family protein